MFRPYPAILTAVSGVVPAFHLPNRTQGALTTLCRCLLVDMKQVKPKKPDFRQ